MKKLFLLSAMFLQAMAAAAQTAPGADTQLIDRILSLWPFLISLLVFLFVILWYQNYQMGRRQRGKTRQIKGVNVIIIVGIVVVLVMVLMAVPWFLQRMENRNDPQDTEMIISPENRSEMILPVEGMTCTGCENTIEMRVGALQGVQTVEADHLQQTTRVVFDSSLTGLPQIIQAIQDAGYRVTGEAVPAAQ